MLIALVTAVMLIAISGSQAADVIPSDTVAVNFGGLKDTLTIPEADETMGESKLVFIWDPKQGQTGPPTTLGFILLCEGVADCGPKAKNPFTGVSDIFTTGVSLGTGNNAMFFFSGPFVNPANPNDPTDASAFVKSIGVDKQRFLGQVQETGKAQDVSSLFKFGLVNPAKGSFVITSDLDVPEPNSLLLVILAVVLLVCRRYSGPTIRA